MFGINQVKSLFDFSANDEWVHEDVLTIEKGDIIAYYDDDTDTVGVGRYIAHYEDIHHASETSPYISENYHSVHRVVIEDVADCGNLRKNYILEDNIFHVSEVEDEPGFWTCYGAYMASQMSVQATDERYS